MRLLSSAFHAGFMVRPARPRREPLGLPQLRRAAVRPLSLSGWCDTVDAGHGTGAVIGVVQGPQTLGRAAPTEEFVTSRRRRSPIVMRLGTSLAGRLDAPASPAHRRRHRREAILSTAHRDRPGHGRRPGGDVGRPAAEAGRGGAPAARRRPRAPKAPGPGAPGPVEV